MLQQVLVWLIVLASALYVLLRLVPAVRSRLPRAWRARAAAGGCDQCGGAGGCGAAAPPGAGSPSAQWQPVALPRSRRRQP